MEDRAAKVAAEIKVRKECLLAGRDGQKELHFLECPALEALEAVVSLR